MAAETSPVYAPDSCSETSCAPSSTPLPASCSLTEARYGDGGHTRNSTPGASPTPSRIPSISVRFSARLPCIFQLPATRYCLTVRLRAPWQGRERARRIPAASAQINVRQGPARLAKAPAAAALHPGRRQHLRLRCAPPPRRCEERVPPPRRRPLPPPSRG